jgi:hypothetical protein
MKILGRQPQRKAAQRMHARCERRKHDSRIMCKEDSPLDGLSICASCKPPSGQTRYRPRQAKESHLRPWMLLAQTPLSSRKDCTRHEHAILEPEARRKRGKGPSQYEVASGGGVEGPRRLGVLDPPSREPSQEAKGVPRIRPEGNRPAATNQARLVAQPSFALK